MTWKDKLELGLKNDAPYRKDNLPEQQVRGPEIDTGPGRSPIIPAAITDAMDPSEPTIPDDRPKDEPPEMVNVSLETIEVPWVRRSLEHTLEALQTKARDQGHDPDYCGPIPTYKQLIHKFRALEDLRTDAP